MSAAYKRRWGVVFAARTRMVGHREHAFNFTIWRFWPDQADAGCPSTLLLARGAAALNLMSSCFQLPSFSDVKMALAKIWKFGKSEIWPIIFYQGKLKARSRRWWHAGWPAGEKRLKLNWMLRVLESSLWSHDLHVKSDLYCVYDCHLWYRWHE